VLKVPNGQTINFRFAFVFSGTYYDPISEQTPIDIFATVVRGDVGSGNIVQPSTSLLKTSYRITEITLPQSLISGYSILTFKFDSVHYLSSGNLVSVYGINQSCDGDYEIVSSFDSTTVTAKKQTTSIPNTTGFDPALHKARMVSKTSAYFKRVSAAEYQFAYTVPNDLQSGIYTVVIQTTYNNRSQIVEHFFETVSKNFTKTGNIISKKLENNIVTLTTDSAHFIEVGEFVSVQETDRVLDGTYKIISVPTATTFEFSLASELTINQTSAYGKYLIKNISGTSEQLTGPTGSSNVFFKPIYNALDESSTNSILFVGHADGIELNEMYKINSMQEAINLLGADMKSPLLRGIFDAYSCGAQNLFVLSAAPMSEYIEDVSKRLEQMPHLISESTGNPVNFYQKYYERLSTSYDYIKNYELIDIVVPLEISLLNTGSTNFISQLAIHCFNFHETTGYIQMGIIGSRSNGIKESDIAVLEANPIFKNKLTTYKLDGQVESDIGRYIIPIYGEVNFNHIGFNRSYTSSAAAAFAGVMSSTPVYRGMIRHRLPGVLSVFGSDLSRESHARLDNLGINTVYRTRRAMRGNPYEVSVSNDYTMASTSNTLSKAPQMRLVAMVINEIKNISNDGIGKNAEEKVTSQVKNILELLVGARVIKDYTMQAYASKTERGLLIFELGLTSALGLKNINFSVTTGPGV
jgi:hypothetical protein